MQENKYMAESTRLSGIDLSIIALFLTIDLFVLVFRNLHCCFFVALNYFLLLRALVRGLRLRSDSSEGLGQVKTSLN